MSSDFDLAMRLAGQGISVFPTYPGGEKLKQPMPGVMWRSQATTDTDQIKRWWGTWPTACPAINLAMSNLFVIDADRHEGGADGVTAWEELCEANGYTPDENACCATAGGGVHFYFKQPNPPLGNSRGSLPKGIDCKGNGGYTIAPGSLRSDGTSYGAADLKELPDVPDWLQTIIRKLPEPEPVKLTKLAPPVSPAGNDRVKAYATKALSDELTRLASEPAGGRNNALNVSAMKLGQMVGAGWITEGEAIAGLEGIAKGWPQFRKSQGTIKSGLSKGKSEPRQELPEDEAPAELLDISKPPKYEVDETGAIHNTETGELVPIEETKPGDTGFPSLPSHLASPAGLVGVVSEWITATARRPNVALSLGAALAVVGTAAGRCIAGPTISGTHLYVIGLAPTGSGKDHPLKQAARLLKASGMEIHTGPSEFISMPAVINFLKRRPLSLCGMDEFGAFLKRINSRRASGFEGAISKILRTAWGSSFSAMATPEWAGRESETIYAPALSIFAASTEEEFFNSLEGADQDNGVLNRFLLMPGGKRTADRDPLLDPLTVPEAISAPIRDIYSCEGPLATGLRNAYDMSPEPKVMEWGEGARDCYRQFSAEIEARSDTVPSEAAFFARTVETALRVASIIAIGRRSSSVDLADMEYGRDLALWSSEALMKGSMERIADTETQAAANRIKRIVRQNGGRIKRTQLLKVLQHRMRSRELNELIAGMIEAESLIQTEGKSTGGRPPILYALPVG